jgi:type I restriction enzyme S subunit
VHAPRLDEIAQINIRSLPASTDPDFEFDYFDIAAAEDGSERELSGRLAFKNAPSRARRLVADESVVYSTVRPLLRRLFTAKCRPNVVYSTGYSILEPLDRCLVGYLKHILVSDRVERQVYARLTGSGYPAINENDLAEVRIPLPDRDKQIAICATLDAREKQQSLYLRYSNALRTQKRGLMQKLLTGEWRLDERFDPEDLTPPALKAGGRS